MVERSEMRDAGAGWRPEGVNYTTMRLDISALHVDYARIDPDGVPRGYQRPLTESRVRALRPINPDLAKSISVNRREDGSFWVMDGNGRRAAMLQEAYDYILADVYQVAPEKEAEYYHRWNRVLTKTSKVQEFAARLTAGEPHARDILRIVTSCGFAIALEGRRTRPYYITAVSALEDLYHGVGPRKAEPEPSKLQAVLVVVQQAWMDVPQATESLMLRGLNRLFVRHSERLRAERLAEVLAAQDPRELMGRAKDAGHKLGKGADHCLADLLQGLYDKGLPARNRLGRGE